LLPILAFVSSFHCFYVYYYLIMVFTGKLMKTLLTFDRSFTFGHPRMDTLITELIVDDWIVGSLQGYRIPLLSLYNYLVSVKKVNV
jgi:hypothetical protein